MTTPVLLVTGFLGAGKTTLINQLLEEAQGERIAAIVNDFGAINIDADLLTGAADQVVGLKNGCICCTLQSDLLRTLRLVLAQEPPPERIIIEASGAADPRGIMEMVLDPVLWGVVSLDAIAAVVDAADCLDDPARLQDPLWRAQAEHADFLLLSKTADLPDGAGERLQLSLAGLRKTVIDIDAEGLPRALLFGPQQAPRAAPAPGRVTAERFVTVEWSSPAPLSLAAFQAGLQDLGQGLVRAKGFLRFAEDPSAWHLFQLVGRRAAFSPAARPAEGEDCRLVLIGTREAFDPEAALRQLAAMTASAPG